MKNENISIFGELFAEAPLLDRYTTTGASEGVDVIIPVIHSNEFWENNLKSFYREIPIRTLRIGDAGCIDNTIPVVRSMPRVVVEDHRQFKTLGYSLRKLIDSVDSEWFIYLHSDVYLPDGWFDAMKKHQDHYDWFGCPMHHVVMVDYFGQDEMRPYAGSQMGRKAAFAPGLANIDDDYVYRQEDLVLAELVEKHGFRHGKVKDISHIHQTIHKTSPWARKLKKVYVDVEWSHEEEVRATETQVHGAIKYLRPTPVLAHWIRPDVARLSSYPSFNWKTFLAWIANTNPEWLPYMKPWRIWAYKFIQSLVLGVRRVIRQ
jgi:hypothetical protein